MAQDGLALLVFNLFSTEYRLIFQYITCESTTKRRKSHGCHRAETDWKIKRITLDASVGHENTRDLRQTVGSYR